MCIPAKPLAPWRCEQRGVDFHALAAAVCEMTYDSTNEGHEREKKVVVSIGQQ